MTTLLPLCFVELLVLSVCPLTQDLAKRSQEKSEKLKAVESGLRELQAKDQRISEEHRKNIYLQRDLDKLKQERTRETWLLKNDLRNLEKSNSELQEQLKEQKKAHQGKSFPRLEYFLLAFCLVF
jgi:septal ring factor EnvC (AmiA/AmiB activator)